MEKRKLPSGSLTIVEHLDELRRRLILCLVYLICGTLVGLFFAKNVIHLLKLPALPFIDTFVVVKPTEAVALYLKAALYAGAFFAAPFIAAQVWHFLVPAVPEESRRGIVYWIAAAGLLFAAGTVFTYYLLVPPALRFLLNLSRDIATPLISLDAYLSLILSLLVLGGIIFEMPVLSALLTRLRVITPRLLRSKRREAIFALLAAAAVLTPTTDIVNMLLFAVPMIVLYELSILVSAAIEAARTTEPGEEAYQHETERPQ